MAKKLLLIITALALIAFAFTSCNNSTEPNNNAGSGNNEQLDNATTFDPNNVTFASAYAQAIDLGFTGTLEEFVELISGKDGANGKDGAPGKDGADGKTPYIENGYWYVDGVNTGVKAEATDGINGANGKDGESIKEVTFDDQGRLVITLTDGSVLDPIELPKKEEHIHEPGEWNEFNGSKEMLYAICMTCKDIIWKFGECNTHTYNETYSYDNSFHWLDCKYCDAITSYAEHNIDYSGLCTVCNQPLGVTEGIIYEISEDGTYAKVVGYNGAATKIVIADTYKGVPVTNIYLSAFYGNNFITSVVIPNSVTGIENYAFSDCTSLKNVTIGDSVKYIAWYVFSGCTSLESVTIGNSVEGIGGLAFIDCSSLTSVTIPNSVTYIGSSAFARCTSLASVTIGNSVEEIGDYAFADCSSLTSVTIPNSLTSIGECAFTECTSLMSITVLEENPTYKSMDGTLYTKDGKTLIQYAIGRMDTSFVIPDGVTSIDIGAFYKCTALTQVTIPDGVTTLCHRAFSSCKGLTSIVLPNSVTIIGTNAFSSCKGLTSIVIPDSVTNINYEAFRDCTSLTSVEIGSNVEIIGRCAFGYCTSLVSITVSDENAVYKSIDGNLYTKDGKTLIQYATGKPDISFVIPNNVTSIGEYAFSQCDNLASVIIPDGVTSIGDSAFYCCSRLSSVTIPSSITSVGGSAFTGCSLELYTEYEYGEYVGDKNNPYAILIRIVDKTLDTYIINENTKIIVDSVFENCDVLTSITIPNSVIHIGDSAFARCECLEIITIGSGITSIPDYAFQYCTNLTSVTIPDSVMSIGDFAFAYCEGLTRITIGNSITSIHYSAFRGCISLTNVTIPDSVTSIGDYVFHGCHSLISITVTGGNTVYKSIDGNLYTADGKTLIQYAIGKPDTSFVILDGVTSVGDYAFAFCDNLTIIEIPNSVTDIGVAAFADCTSLTNVIISDSVISIGEFAFYTSTAITDIYYTGSVEDWSKINIGYGNDELLNATIHYNYVPEE